MKKISTLAMLLFFVVACAQQEKVTKEQPERKIHLVTNYGEIVLKLYNETPLHRDNFTKIVDEGVLDSVLFHRVIESFMIQAGDTSSKKSKATDTLGGSDLPYAVPAEITKTLFHKKGVLAAARSDTPTRESSSTQFYIVQGKVFNDSLLDNAEKRINTWLSQHFVKQDPLHKEKLDSLNVALKEENWKEFGRINNQFRELAKEYTNFESYSIPEAHKTVYKTIGGTPHLDQNYTVFGEVVAGLKIVDSIAAVETNKMDRPLKDVRILKARVVNESP